MYEMEEKVYWPNGRLKRDSPRDDAGELHGICNGWKEDGSFWYTIGYVHGKLHGIWKEAELNSGKVHIRYYIYRDEVDEEEYRKHILVEKMAGIS